MKDPGLQPERTGLAWSRTGLLALLTACLSIRIGLSVAAVAHLLVALLLAGLSCATLYSGHFRSRHTVDDHVVTTASRRFLFVTSAVIVVAAAVHASLILTRLLK